MADNMITDLGFEFGDDEVTQESYDAGTSAFKDLFDEKFTSFNPEAIISGGNNKLKSGMFSMEVEETPDIALGYKKNDEPLTPKRPGRFFD
jgi:hypothetical protein